MGYHPFLPTAGARVNVLCVPAGPITPDRFQKFMKLLQNAVVTDRQAARSPEPSQASTASSSEAGSIFYDVSASQDTRRPHLFPFETNSRCQVLLGLIDGERTTASSDQTTPTQHDSKAAVSVQSIMATFSEQQLSTPGLIVRQLIYCGPKPCHPLDSNVLYLSDADCSDAAGNIMIKISEQFVTGSASVIEDLKGQPISMVPGASSQMPRRSGTIPVPADGSSTPASAKPPSPMPTSSEQEQQSETSRGRFLVIQGMYRLQGASWTAAMSSLSDGATMAQSGHDHLWHAKALECLLICMLLLAWSGTTFTVPQVCRSLPNRGWLFQSELASKSGDSLKTLALLMTPMAETILELYSKVANLDLGGSLQDVLRESRVRLVNLLIFAKRAGGVLNRQTLHQIIAGQGDVSEKAPSSSGEHVAVTRAGLANILIETLQESQSSNNLAHHTNLLVGVASSLSTLGLDRKHAFYVKQLMQQFVYKLIEARKVGASEVGVHPAAGLPPLSSALQGIIPEMVVGMRIMLELAAGAYGVSLPPVPQVRQRVPATLDTIQSNLRVYASEHGTGDTFLKLEMLRTCVSVSEALADVPAGLHFTSSILRGAKQVVTVPNTPPVPAPLISAEEQVRLLDSLKRAVLASFRLGAGGCRAEYWDDFLVRDVQVFERDTFAKLIAHKPSDLSIRGSGLVETVRDPFIYNPFSKDKSVPAAPVLVAGELATFAVVLQNALDVEIEIEDISLITEGCQFTPSRHSIILGPLSTQVFFLSGTPTESGDLDIVGCRATIRHCYEQDFLVFREDWKPPVTAKQNAVGRVRFKTGRPSVAGEENTRMADFQLPTPSATSLKLKVISAQPRLLMKSKSLGDPAIMLLEGESRVLELNLINESETVPADLVLVTSEDSVTTRLQDALSSKDLSPAELYEIQNQLRAHPAVDIRNQQQASSDKILGPAKSIDYTVEIFGRAGLVSATLQADYAYLGSSSAEVKATFYTRQDRFPIAVTVNGSVEIPRCNVLPVHGDFIWNSATEDSNHQVPTVDDHLQSSTVSTLSHWLTTRPDADDYCMLTLDLRNVWPQPLVIDIQARKLNADSVPEDQLWEGAYSVTETLQPGHVSRVILLVPRLFIRDPHAPIPTIETQKQFVVTTSKLSAEAEAATRESFWYREELLKCLRGTWREESSGRHGEIDLRKGIRLSPRMVDVLRKDHVSIEYGIEPYEPSRDEDRSGTVTRIGRAHFAVKTESFATLSVTIHNHTQETLRLLLRLQPALRHQQHNIALDLSKRFGWSGVLQRALHPPIKPGGVCVADLGIIALSQGDYEINASVEEIRGRRIPATAPAGDAVDAGSERRIWHARSACSIDAIEH